MQHWELDMNLWIQQDDNVRRRIMMSFIVINNFLSIINCLSEIFYKELGSPWTSSRTHTHTPISHCSEAAGMPISQRMPSVMSLLSNSAMEDQACLVSKPWHCPGRMAGSGWNCLPITSYTVYTVITWVSYLTFGVESSSPLATSYLVHSACFQHEADQSRSFIASEVTTLWNSTDHTHLSAFGTNMRYEFIGHLNKKSHHADVHFFKEFWNDLETKCCALQTEKNNHPFPAAENTGKYHSPRTNPAQQVRIFGIWMLDWFRLYPPSTAQHMIYMSLHHSLRRWTYTLSLN